MLVAIEGADGVGKHTAATGLRDALRAQGLTACMLSFPRYQDTVGGHVLGEFLAGRLPVPTSPEAAAVLYALDRLESRKALADAAAAHEFIILDRYIASNMVYQASKVAPEQSIEMMKWIWDLETETFGVRPPDVSIYLDTSLENARELMLLKKQRSYTERTHDEHEADLTLQRRVRRNYAALAGDEHFGRWYVVHAETAAGLRKPNAIVDEILLLLTNHLGRSGDEISKRSTA